MSNIPNKILAGLSVLYLAVYIYPGVTDKFVEFGRYGATDGLRDSVMGGGYFSLATRGLNEQTDHV